MQLRQFCVSKMTSAAGPKGKLFATSITGQKRFYVKEISWCKPRDERRSRLPQLAAVKMDEVSFIYVNVQ
jgi:hypothetical protein